MIPINTKKDDSNIGVPFKHKLYAIISTLSFNPITTMKESLEKSSPKKMKRCATEIGKSSNYHSIS